MKWLILGALLAVCILIAGLTRPNCPPGSMAVLTQRDGWYCAVPSSR